MRTLGCLSYRIRYALLPTVEPCVVQCLWWCDDVKMPFTKPWYTAELSIMWFCRSRKIRKDEESRTLRLGYLRRPPQWSLSIEMAFATLWTKLHRANVSDRGLRHVPCPEYMCQTYNKDWWKILAARFPLSEELVVESDVVENLGNFQMKRVKCFLFRTKVI